jgi:two-component system response regulator YesN
LGNIETFHPNLIFLEIHLPADNGLDLARRIKARYPAIMIVVLTYNIQEYQEAAEELGVEHIIPKDVWTGEDIIKLVQSIMSELGIDLKRKQNRDQLQEQSSRA